MHLKYLYVDAEENKFYSDVCYLLREPLLYKFTILGDFIITLGQYFVAQKWMLEDMMLIIETTTNISS